LRELAGPLPIPARLVLPHLTTPALSGFILNRLVKEPALRRTMATYLSNTAAPTVVRAGAKTNVIPATAMFEIDGRTLPGQTEADFLRELRRVIGDEAALDVIASQPPVVAPADTPLFRCLCETIRAHDPEGIPIPSMIPGFTDAKAYTKLGTTYYGFAPVRFAPDDGLVFAELYHGKNERIPEAGLRWGLRTLYDAVTRFTTQRAR
jgi:acetylornithine deacetylase/succinyl-diaminopimelate desuccinylase-like protein